jgi:multimeric flavodoxin WrbA
MHEHGMLRQVRDALEGVQPQAAVFGVGGSPRKNGNSDALLAEILKGVRDQAISGTGMHLRDIRFSACIGCEQCRKDGICTGLVDGMTVIYPHVQQAKGLVLVSPTHNYNVTAWMKAFIDRLYCFYVFANTRPRTWSSRLAGQGRKAVLAAICEQEHQADMGFTLEAMRLPLKALGYEIVGELPVLRVFDRGKVKENKEVLDAAKRLGEELALSLNR